MQYQAGKPQGVLVVDWEKESGRSKGSDVMSGIESAIWLNAKIERHTPLTKAC
jgi:hypothetical protein